MGDYLPAQALAAQQQQQGIKQKRGFIAAAYQYPLILTLNREKPDPEITFTFIDMADYIPAQLFKRGYFKLSQIRRDSIVLQQLNKGFNPGELLRIRNFLRQLNSNLVQLILEFAYDFLLVC
jgi:hypothetical protein